MLFRRRKSATATLPAAVPARNCTAVGGVRPATTTPARKRVVLDWGSASRGARRGDHNEDSFCTAAPVFVVADGMGGHAAGELASSAVAASMATLGGRSEVTDSDIGACITEARNRIGHIAAEEGNPAGSTLTGVIVTESESPCWTVLNIGDSRTYLLDSGALIQLTTDHSVAQELVDDGAVSLQDAHSHRHAHVLTRALLHTQAYPLDVSEIPLHRGDRVLVCSDGVSGTLDNDALTELLRSSADPRDAAVAIVAAVLDAGGTDDATALVIDAVEVV